MADSVACDWRAAIVRSRVSSRDFRVTVYGKRGSGRPSWYCGGISWLRCQKESRHYRPTELVALNTTSYSVHQHRSPLKTWVRLVSSEPGSVQKASVGFLMPPVITGRLPAPPSSGSDPNCRDLGLTVDGKRGKGASGDAGTVAANAPRYAIQSENLLLNHRSLGVVGFIRHSSVGKAQRTMGH